MNKNVSLDEHAVALLDAHKGNGESYSKVIRRIVRPPIRSGRDLLKWVHDPSCPEPDYDVAEELHRERKRKRRHAA